MDDLVALTATTHLEIHYLGTLVLTLRYHLSESRLPRRLIPFIHNMNLIYCSETADDISSAYLSATVRVHRRSDYIGDAFISLQDIQMANIVAETYINEAAETEDIFTFNDHKFFLEEREIPRLTIDFSTPIEIIKAKLKKYKNNLTSFHINACSIPKHYDEIARILIETDVDILGISETFICEKTPKMFYEIPGYKFFHKDRTMKSRGGTGLYIKEGITCKEIQLCKEVIQPEMCFVEVSCNNTKLAVGVIYKSPLISYTEYAVLTEVLAPIITGYEHHIILRIHIYFLKTFFSHLFLAYHYFTCIIN